MSNNKSFTKKVCYTVQSCAVCVCPITFLQQRHECQQCRQISCGLCSEKTLREHGVMCNLCVTNKHAPKALCQDSAIDETNSDRISKNISVQLPSQPSKGITNQHSILHKPHSEIEYVNLQRNEEASMLSVLHNDLDKDCTNKQEQNPSPKTAGFESVGKEKMGPVLSSYHSLQFQPQMKDEEFSSLTFFPKKGRQDTYLNGKSEKNDEYLRVLHQEKPSGENDRKSDDDDWKYNDNNDFSHSLKSEGSCASLHSSILLRNNSKVDSYDYENITKSTLSSSDKSAANWSKDAQCPESQNSRIAHETSPANHERMLLPTGEESECFNIPANSSCSVKRTNDSHGKKLEESELSLSAQNVMNSKSTSLRQNPESDISEDVRNMNAIKFDMKLIPSANDEAGMVKTGLSDWSGDHVPHENKDQSSYDGMRNIPATRKTKSGHVKKPFKDQNPDLDWKENPFYSDSFEMQSNRPIHRASKVEMDCNDYEGSGDSMRLSSGESDGYGTARRVTCHPGCAHYHRQQNAQKMENVILDRGLEIKDVSYDGNCMFRAIIDQLYINGEFSFSSRSLRVKAVDYLRKNPKHEDGTHMESFLLSESWEQYLARMAQVGEWGDHMILNAIASVTGRKLMVFSSDSDVGQTTIEPNGSVKKEGALSIGHVGQSHFVSLRPVDWRTSWYKNLEPPNEESMSIEDKRDNLLSDKFAVDNVSGVPMSHFTFLLKNILHTDCFQMCLNPSQWVTAMEKPRHSFKREMVGSAVEGLEARIIDMNDRKCHFSATEAEIWCISSDKHVLWPDETSGKPGEIIADIQSSHPGYTRLAYGHYGKYYTYDWSHTDNYRDVVAIMPMVFHISSWPPNALEWITRDRNFSWPKQSTIRSMVSAGCHAVPQAHFKTIDSDTDFLISFGVAEKILSEDISRDQQHCYHIFKNLIKWQTSDITNLSEYHLKTVFYHACEEIPPKLWKKNLGACLLYMVDKLLECLKNHNLPHYFIKENNLIDYYSEESIQSLVEKVNGIRMYPVMSVLYLADAHSLPDTEIVESVIEDFEAFKSHRSLWITASEVFLPITIELIRTPILYQQYLEALNIARRSFEEFVHYFTEKDFGEFIIRVISGGPQKQVWFFSLASDLVLGTSVTRHLAVNQKKQTLREILGGEDENELGDLAIPTSLLSCNSFSFAFVCDFANFLYDLGRYNDSAHYFKSCSTLCKKALKDNESKTLSRTEMQLEKEYNYERMMRQQMILQTMWMALWWLWHVYSITDRSFEFLSEMDDIENVCENLSNAKNYGILAKMWEELGCEEKAALARANQSALQ